MAAEAAHEAGHQASAHLPSLFQLLDEALGGRLPDWVVPWQAVWFTVMAMVFLGAVTAIGARQRKPIPRGLQNFVEMVVSGFDDFVCSILGPAGRAHTPFIGTLFLYILVMNWMGLIPLFHSPVAHAGESPIGLPIPMTTLPLAICSVIYVNLAALRASGLKGYCLHMCGSPTHFLLWLVSPLILVIHTLGELSKVFSLSMRLFGNISGEDTLIAVIIGQSVSLAKALHLPPVLPLHFPFLLLGLLTGLVQAFVFALLTTIYLALMLPHEEPHDASEEASAVHAA